ncbi:carbohydrate-binding module family 14 protein [Streptomyces sp. NPDC057697]|uniref:carbohydrate-binding module family 14 protein n=1 Tax=Streptomyces sp. NPDC057697 TaxID=3346219 RepID=UPI00367ACE18
MKRALAPALTLALALAPSVALAEDTAPRAAAGPEAPGCPEVDNPSGNAVVLADTSDPSVYYVCSNGEPHKVVCPEGTLFSKFEKVCDWEWNIQFENG